MTNEEDNMATPDPKNPVSTSTEQNISDAENTLRKTKEGLEKVQEYRNKQAGQLNLDPAKARAREKEEQALKTNKEVVEKGLLDVKRVKEKNKTGLRLEIKK